MKEKTIIRNGMIADGTKNMPYRADILVVDDKIAEINEKLLGDLNDTARIIDAAGRFVTPGFVDIHRHCDYAVLKEDFGAIELSQGITSVVTGSCGLTPFPLRHEYKQQFDNLLSPCLGSLVHEELFYNYKDYAGFLCKQPLPVHIGNLIGSCSVRIAVKGFVKTAFSRNEMEQAKALIEEAMSNGALGLSMGIMYTPEFYSTEEELSELAGAAAKHGGVLTSHIRGEGDSLVSSVKEIIGIAKKAEIPLQISHFKSCGMHNWQNGIYKAIELIERERNTGMDISVDFYPYIGGSTTLLSLIPPCFLRSTLKETWDFMGTDKAREELEFVLSKNYDNWDNYLLSLGFQRIIITSTELSKNKRYIGKTLADIIKEGYDPYQFLCDIMSEEQGRVGIIVMSMSQLDVDVIAKLPYSFVISDALYAESGVPHPRLYAAFPKILRDFVKERNVLSLTEAIQKMTGKPAEKMRLKNRGKIKEGFIADINIFDLDHVSDNSDFVNSKILSSGMDYVMVGGKIRWRNETLVGENNGVYLSGIRR